MSDLGDVVGAMHHDKAVVLRSQHASIAVEIGERQRITTNIARSVQEEILDIGSVILNLTVAQQPDLYLKERVTLEDQRRTLTRELRTEELSAWRDMQELRREQRTIEHELTQDWQRRKRLEDLDDASGSF